MEEKNGFHYTENQFPLAEKKSLNKRILFQLGRKSVSISRNGVFA